MSAKILQLANSACFGPTRHLTRIQAAVVHLGTELIRNLALTVHVFSQFKNVSLQGGFSFQAQQEHAALVARVAARLIPDRRFAQDAFTAGLLHDIGKVILAMNLPELFAETIRVARMERRALHAVEAEVFGVTHAEVGAYLLGLWGVPYPIVEGVALHHAADPMLRKPIGIASAVSLADALVQELAGPPQDELLLSLEGRRVDSDLSQWRSMAREEARLPAGARF